MYKLYNCKRVHQFRQCIRSTIQYELQPGLVKRELIVVQALREGT